MAIASSTATAPKSKGPGQRLLVDTGRMTVRRVSRNEQSVMNALKTLAPAERKRKRAQATEGTP